MIDDKGWKNICETDIVKQFQDFYKGVIVACLLLLPLSVRCALVLEPETLDFGEIRYSDISEVTKKATIFNNTDREKTLVLVNSSCSCTTSTDFPLHLNPGERREFVVNIKPSSVGTFTSVLTIAESLQKEDSVNLFIQGTVSSSLQMTFHPSVLVVESTATIGLKLGNVFIEVSDEKFDVSQCDIICRDAPVELRNLSNSSNRSIKADIILAAQPTTGDMVVKVLVAYKGTVIGIDTVRLCVLPGIDVRPECVYFGFIPLGDCSSKAVFVKKSDFEIERVDVIGIDPSLVKMETSIACDEKGTTITTKAMPISHATWTGHLQFFGHERGNVFKATIPIQGGGG